MSYRLVKTRYSNLVRDSESGVYFCRAKVLGRKICKSLKTSSVEIAKDRLSDLLHKERFRLERVNEQKPAKEGDTFKANADAWLSDVDANPALKPSSRKYRRETLDAIRRAMPELDAMKIHAVSEGICRKLFSILGKKFSAGRFNGSIESMRGIFEKAIRLGYAASNPRRLIERIP